MAGKLQIPAPYTDEPLRAGLPILTLDNRRLGHLKEFTDTHIKVDARFRRDFWVARDQVGYVDERCVGLLFRSDELELYRLIKPQQDEFVKRQPRASAY